MQEGNEDSPSDDDAAPAASGASHTEQQQQGTDSIAAAAAAASSIYTARDKQRWLDTAYWLCNEWVASREKGAIVNELDAAISVGDATVEVYATADEELTQYTAAPTGGNDKDADAQQPNYSSSDVHAGVGDGGVEESKGGGAHSDT